MWFTSLFGALRLASGGAQAERVCRKACKQSVYRKHRSRHLAIEALEDRLCLSLNLLVSSYGNDSVMRYEGTTGAFLGAFVIPGYGGLYGPHGLLIGLDGNLLVSSTESHAVLRYNSTTGGFMGAFVPPFSGGLARVHGIIFGLDGNLLVSSPETSSIKRYDGTTGAFLGDFVPPGSGGLGQPTGLVIGPDGNLYVNSVDTSSVMRYDGTTGQPLPAPGQGGAFFVTPGSGGLNFPSMAITFGPDANLYVGGYFSHNVLRYDGTTGTFIDTFVSAGSGGLSQTQGLAFGPDGNFYVCSNANSRVLRYDGTTGVFIDAFVPPGGPLNAPTYLLFWDTGMQGPSGNGGVRSHHVGVGTPASQIVGGASALLTVVTASQLPAGANHSDSVSAVLEARPVHSATVQQPPEDVASAWAMLPRSTERTAENVIFTARATEHQLKESLPWLSASEVDLLAFDQLGRR